MSAHEFFFTLEVSSQGAPAPLVELLASHVFRHVGCSQGSLPALAQAIEHATAKPAAGHRRCDVQFRAHNGHLDVLVSTNGGRVYQDTLVIP